jgi:hypothetical protein
MILGYLLICYITIQGEETRGVCYQLLERSQAHAAPAVCGARGDLLLRGLALALAHLAHPVDLQPVAVDPEVEAAG